MMTARSVTHQVDVWQRRHGYSPTVRELAEEAEASVSVTHGHLVQARYAGWVTWIEGRPRTLRCLRRP